MRKSCLNLKSFSSSRKNFANIRQSSLDGLTSRGLVGTGLSRARPSNRYLLGTFEPGFVWKNPLRFYPAGLIRINPPGKSQKNPLEGGFF